MSAWSGHSSALDRPYQRRVETRTWSSAGNRSSSAAVTRPWPVAS